MSITHSMLLTGASGVGKSTLARGALETYGSGLVVLAPGTDEIDSYTGLVGNPNYVFQGFDDMDFDPGNKEWNANGHSDLVKWLKVRYEELKSDVDAGKELRYKVLVVDTESAVARLAYNATLAKFRFDKPPPSISPDGAAFYGFLRVTLESSVRRMRAIRGLGVHWIATAHPVESEVTQIQKTDEDIGKTKIMPDIPGGFKNSLPSFFNVVLNVNIGKKEVKRVGTVKPEVVRVHYAQWAGDAKRVTKCRFGALADKGYIVLPPNAKLAWKAIADPVEAAAERLAKGEIGG